MLKSIDPTILANSNPFSFNKTVVGIPLKPSFLANVIDESYYILKFSILRSLKKIDVFSKFSCPTFIGNIFKLSKSLF